MFLIYPSKVANFYRENKNCAIYADFKFDDTSIMINYWPIYVLPCFSKMLEKIINNGPLKYLTENNLWYCKQFGLLKGLSPEHVILQLNK